MRIRIALTTAVAVIIGMTTGFFSLGTRHAASAEVATHRPRHAAHTTVLSHASLAGFALPVRLPVGWKGPPPPPPPPPPAPPPVPITDADSVATADWMCIRVHESSDRYNSPAAPDGAYGILLSTWRSFGLSGWAYQAPASLQDRVALELYARYGFRPWSSRFACGL
ncbi:MAG: hypothetical protein ACLQRH_21835 [Acidimicrobiales bacterium]